MKTIKGLKWVLASALIVTSSQADVIIDSQTIPGSDIQSISISPSTGNIFVTTISGYDVTTSGTNTGGTSGSTTVAITGFSASPASITEGQSVDLSWATSNAVSCTPSNGNNTAWPGSTIGVNGSQAVTISTAGTYQFTLTCNGSSSDTDVATVSVVVGSSVNTGPTNCSAPALSGGNVVAWSSFWGGTEFPLPSFATSYATVPRQGYLALKFNTGSIVDDAFITSIETTQTDGARFGAFSECPGDFNVAPECDYVWGLGGGIHWATDGMSGACQLKPNTTYYFNITFTDGVNPGSTTCSSTPCVTKLQVVNR